MSKYIMIHVLLSFVIAFIATLLLIKDERKSYKRMFLFLLLFNLSLPFLAYVVTLLFAPIIAFANKKSYIHGIKTFNKEEFLKSPYPKVRRFFGEGGVTFLVKDKSHNSPHKMKSLVFMTKNPNKESNALIRGLLSDHDYEVRLYSFSFLNGQEEALNKKISHLLQELDKTHSDTHRATVHREIALLYWQFIESGLIEVKNANMMLDKATFHVNQSLGLSLDRPSPELLYLLAKIYFKKSEYRKATTYFAEAVKKGLSKDVVMPYLAEIAYEERDFETVQHLIQAYRPKDISYPLEAVYLQWRKS